MVKKEEITNLLVADLLNDAVPQDDPAGSRSWLEMLDFKCTGTAFGCTGTYDCGKDFGCTNSFTCGTFTGS